ncbi:MAG: hypothetical protein LBP21_02690 [Synergistaceae bacterium]|nr:hypothetical protein [Synergistaceae bacterium]
MSELKEMMQTEMILNTSILPEPLIGLIHAPQMKVQKTTNGGILLIPLKNSFDCTAKVRGMLAGSRYMSVDKFLERKRADMELER